VCIKKAKVKLADGKDRTIQHMVSTTFWHRDGTPISAQQFMELLFGKLPEFFESESELRKLWSAPDTRKKLLYGLAEKGFGHEQLTEMQKIIDAEKSDIFDVLAYVAYAMPPLTREERAARAKIAIATHFTSRQQSRLLRTDAESALSRRARSLPRYPLVRATKLVECLKVLEEFENGDHRSGAT
jgi:type I restriction enzyme, R subunit